MQYQEGATNIYCDNNSTIELLKNHVFHKRRKHIDTIYHFIREHINNGEIYLEFCKSEDQTADIFTKSLAKERFEHLRKGLGIIEKSRLRGSVEMCKLDGTDDRQAAAQPSAIHRSSTTESSINHLAVVQ